MKKLQVMAPAGSGIPLRKLWAENVLEVIEEGITGRAEVERDHSFNAYLWIDHYPDLCIRI